MLPKIKYCSTSKEFLEYVKAEIIEVGFVNIKENEFFICFFGNKNVFLNKGKMYKNMWKRIEVEKKQGLRIRKVIGFK